MLCPQSQSDCSAAVLPLPVTPFEYYYLCDDRPAYPMTFPIELRFRGQLDQPRFTQALQQTVARHPLLSACVNHRRRRPSWITSPAPLWIDWQAGSPPVEHPSGEWIDLTQERPLRSWVRVEGESTRVVHQFHHAACDGIAAFKVLEEWMTVYAGDDATGPLDSLDPDLLRKRGDFRDPATALGRWDGWRTATQWMKSLARRPALLAAPTHTTTQPPLLDMAIAVLDIATTSSLRQIAASHGASLNDLLLRDMALAICQWNRQHGKADRRRVWLNVPINLRRRQDRAMPAANRIGFGFVSLDPKIAGDTAASLWSIHGQIESLRVEEVGRRFVEGLGVACPVPGLVPWMLRRNRCFATLVHSNLGRVFHHAPLPTDNGQLNLGDAVLEQVAGAPPIRPLTRGALAAMQYAGRLSLALRCDPKLFSPADTRDLLDMYVGQLQQSIDRGE